MIFSGSWANSLVIEILVILAVVRAFRAMAVLKGLNSLLWAWIGGLSYYLPMLLFGLLIFPYLLEQDFAFIDSELIVNSFSILNIIVGITCSGATYLYLNSKPNESIKSELDIIDQV